MCSNLLNEFYNKMEIKIPNQFMYIEQNKDFQFSNRNVSLSPKCNNKFNISHYINLSNFSKNVRNRWTDIKNLGESFEIKGTLSRKNSKEIKKSTKGEWENLLNKSVDNIRPGKRIIKLDKCESIHRNNKSSSQNTSFELAEFGRASGKKTEFPHVKKSLAIGSISNFISSIPSYSQRAKKFYENNHHNDSIIFSPDFHKYTFNERRIITKLNSTKLTKDNKEAGIPSSYNLNSYINKTYKMKETYVKLAGKKTNNEIKLKNSKKFSNKTNTSTIFSTDVSYSKHSARKTFYDNDNYKKFFNKNFGY